MLIATILFAIILITQGIVIFYLLSLVSTLKETDSNNQKRFQAAMDKVVALDKQPPVQSSPNEAIEDEEDSNLMDENAPWEIPEDVKITVEGGDTLVPPGFEAI